MRGMRSWVAVAAALVGVAAGAPAWADGATTYSLQECIRAALERSPSHGQAEEQFYAASSNVGLARASLLPQLSANTSGAQYSRDRIYFDQRASGANGAFGVTSRRAYGANLSFSQELFDGFASWNRLSAAGARRDAAEAGVRDSRLATTLRVKEAYLELLRSEHLLKVAEETRDETQHQQDRVQALYDVGSVARADVLQNKVQLGQDELGEISARNRVEIAKATLLNAMGREMDSDIAVEELPDPEPGPPPALETLLPEAETKNAGLADLHAAAVAAHEDLDASRGARLPSLALSWDYGWGNYRLPVSRTDWTDHADWTAQLTVNLNIFDGLATRSSIAAARHNYESAKLAENQAKLDLALEVRRQQSSLLEAGERIRVAGESVTSAEEQVRLEEERYRLGSATLLQLIDAQVGLTRAKSSEVEAKYDYSLAQARLDRAIGRE